MLDMNKMLKQTTSTLKFTIFSMMVAVMFVAAAGFNTEADAAGVCKGRYVGVPAWYNNLPCQGDVPEITSLMQLWIIALNIAEMFIIIAGYLAIAFFAWGGFTYLTSQGDPGKLAAAKNTILNSIIGLVIVLSATAIIEFVQNSIQKGLV